MNRNKHLHRPTELGPWPLTVQPKEDDEGVKQNETLSIDDYFQKQTLRLPKIQRSLGSVRSKLALKLSQRSIQLNKQPITTRSHMNGSVVRFYKSNGIDTDSFNFSQSAVLRRDSKQIDSPYTSILPPEQKTKQKTRVYQANKLVNYESAKKRSLLYYIKQVSHKREMMQLYLQNRAIR